jgi:hypothetical protein
VSPTVLIFGFQAGATILLGLPIARLRQPSPTLRIALNAGAVGVLLFLVWDVLSAALAADRHRPHDPAVPGFALAVRRSLRRPV